jgi:hypothetical protein
MSDHSINTSIEFPASAVEVGLQDTPQPISPESPQTIENTLANFHSDPGVSHIIALGLGLVETIRQRDVQHQQEQAEQQHLETTILNLRGQIEELTPDNPPTGFLLNGDNLAPNFALPIQEGYSQPAYWVKKLPDGRVAGLPQDCKPGDTPFIGNLYAERPIPCPLENEDHNPIFPLPLWLQQLLQGPSVNFETLWQEVQSKGDWGLQAEVSRYRTLHHSIQEMEMQLAKHQAVVHAVRQAKDLCQGRLEVARLETKMSELHRASGSRHSPQLARSNRGGYSRRGH